MLLPSTPGISRGLWCAAISEAKTPFCTTSPRWLEISCPSRTTPRSPLLVRRVESTVDSMWIVSPNLTAPRNFHSSTPSSARLVPLKMPVWIPSPEAIESTSSPCATGSPNAVSRANSRSTCSGFMSPERPANVITSDSVTVRPAVTNLAPTSKSSKYIPVMPAPAAGLRSA